MLLSQKRKKKIPIIILSFGCPTLITCFFTYFLFSPFLAEYSSVMAQAPRNIVLSSPKEENPNLLTGAAPSLICLFLLELCYNPVDIL